MKTALQLSEPEETNSGEGADEEHNQNQHTLGEEQQNQVMKQRNTGQPKRNKRKKTHTYNYVQPSHPNSCYIHRQNTTQIGKKQGQVG